MIWAKVEAARAAAAEMIGMAGAAERATAAAPAANGVAEEASRAAVGSSLQRALEEGGAGRQVVAARAQE